MDGFNMIELTKEQQDVHDKIIDWLNKYYKNEHDEYFVSFSGLAGTGKTTLINFIAATIRNHLNSDIAFCTFTGKASVVLKSKLVDLDEFDYIGTIHSLIYRPIIDPDTKEIKGWYLRDEIDQNVIIIDEASMVSKDLWKDLLNFRIPIICVGDHGQLPPVSNDTFSLMNNPKYKLETIHRQAAENPIIKLSMLARNEGFINTGIYGKEAAKLDYSHPSARKALKNFKLDNNKQILCGMNKTRASVNKLIRKNLGFDRPEPFIGEKIICLKNNKKLNVMNGQMGFIKNITLHSKHLFELQIRMDGMNYDIFTLALKKTFGVAKYGDYFEIIQDPEIKLEAASSKYRHNDINVFDFGYCISVHKSQGSEWDNVILIEEYNSYQSEDDMTRWLYTGITRAAKKLLIIEDFY